MHASAASCYNVGMADKWLTTKQASELTGYHIDHVRRLIKTGKVKSRKVMRDWQISQSDLLVYVRKTEKLGAKRGPKVNA